jgi:hypothetical protein
MRMRVLSGAKDLSWHALTLVFFPDRLDSQWWYLSPSAIMGSPTQSELKECGHSRNRDSNDGRQPKDEGVQRE